MTSGLLASAVCTSVDLFSHFFALKFNEIMQFLALYLFGDKFVGYTVFGAVLGWGVSWGSEQGYYHVIMLPLIALYMEGGNFSVLGTLDVLCLCMPCAGVCTAVYALSLRAQRNENVDRVIDGTNTDSDRNNKSSDGSNSNFNSNNNSNSDSSSNSNSDNNINNQDQDQTYEHHTRLGLIGAISNTFMGDFVEACYPYSLTNSWVLFSVRVGAAIAGGLIVGYYGLTNDCKIDEKFSLISSVFRSTDSGPFKSSAYLPLPLVILLASIGSDDRCVGTGTATHTHDKIFLTNNNNSGNFETLSDYIFDDFYGQIQSISHPGSFSVLLISVLVSYLLPFLVTLIAYSGKGALNKKS